MPIPPVAQFAAPGSPGVALHFAVSIEGFSLNTWSKAAGLEVSWDLVEYRAGDQDNERWIFPGTTKYKPVTLERPATRDGATKVRQWLSSNSFVHTTQAATIVLRDASLRTVMSWTLRRVLPVRWSITALDASSSKVAIETLELAHTGFLEESKSPAAPGALALGAAALPPAAAFAGGQ